MGVDGAYGEFSTGLLPRNQYNMVTLSDIIFLNFFSFMFLILIFFFFFFFNFQYITRKANREQRQNEGKTASEVATITLLPSAEPRVSSACPLPQDGFIFVASGWVGDSKLSDSSTV
jgi:hypothetical protein